MSHGVLITAAPVGGGPPRAGTATLAGIVAAALACEAAGAGLLHLHVRDEAGATTTDPRACAALVARVRAAGARAPIALSAGDDAGAADHARRIALADCGAELASLAGGAFNAGGRLYDNGPGYQRAMARALARAGARPEVEIFDTGQVAVVADLMAAGLIPRPAWLNLVFGAAGGMPVDAGLLSWLVPRLPHGAA